MVERDWSPAAGRAASPRDFGLELADAVVVSRRAALSDAQWEQISPLLPSSDGRQGRPFRDHRQVLEGIVYRYRTGVAWRDLPAEWSRTPWHDLDTIGHPDLPPGRYVSASTQTAIGTLRVAGVCVPWHDAHVRTGRADRLRWQDHAAYLALLPEVLANNGAKGTLVVAGDFNQTVPGTRAPAHVQDLLGAALRGLRVVTATRSCGRRMLDHIAVDAELNAASVEIECLAHTDEPLSDHDAAIATLRRESERRSGRVA